MQIPSPTLPAVHHPERPSMWLQLPLSFDLARMQRDIGQFQASDWISHANTMACESGWHCLPLRSSGGDARHIGAGDGAMFADTPHLARCPGLQQALDAFDCETLSVRLMALAPGASIQAHRDKGTSIADGVTRIHVPVQTSPQVLFTIEGETVHFTAGHAWYMDASCLHAVDNRGSTARIHLVIDCITNRWLEALFARAGFVARPAPKYGAAGIDDGNIRQVIASLRASATPGGLALADQLAALADGAAA